MLHKKLYKKYFIDKYGSRRGAIRTYRHKFLNTIGCYKQYANVDWASIDRLVFVCKGNICRSAYAEAIAKSLGLQAISCGVSTKDNVPANKDAIKVAQGRGVNLKAHKTSRLTSVKLRPTDLLIAMEPWHAEFLKDNLDATHNITLLGLWAPSRRPHLHDPYGLSAIYFDNCFEYIEKAVYEIEKKIKSR